MPSSNLDNEPKDNSSPKVPADKGTGGVMAIQLVLEILEALAKQDSVGVTELSKALGTTKARVFRHLRTLVAQNYAIQHEGSDRYAAGPQLLALSRIAGLTPHEAILRLARPVMVGLRDKFGHTVNFSVAFGDTATIVETLQGNSFIGVVMQTHSGMPLHSTAAGKLLLAEQLAKDAPWPKGPYEKFTENTITDEQALRMELASIEKQGWAAAPEETVLGINALSAPIRDHKGDLVAMISMLSSIQYIGRQPDRTMIEGVQHAAQEISAALTL